MLGCGDLGCELPESLPWTLSDTMVLTYSLAFPADWKFLASGSDVKVVQAYRP